jgi:hypothetical protein
LLRKREGRCKTDNSSSDDGDVDFHVLLKV